jgi:hypothetical protein
MKLMHRVLGLALLLAAVTTTAAGCVFVPAGPRYGYRPVAPVVVAPVPAVVVRPRPYGYYYW